MYAQKSSQEELIVKESRDERKRPTDNVSIIFHALQGLQCALFLRVGAVSFVRMQSKLRDVGKLGSSPISTGPALSSPAQMSGAVRVNGFRVRAGRIGSGVWKHRNISGRLTGTQQALFVAARSGFSPRLKTSTTIQTKKRWHFQCGVG